jgi:hypothetical protein
MKDPRRLFAKLTTTIEDLHGIAVDGQAPDLSVDIQLSLLASIKVAIANVAEVMTQISDSIAETNT